MSQPLELTQSTPKAWCGRSWEGLVDRRRAAFAQALALKGVTETNCSDVVERFLEFFDATGVGLLRDEEEWIFRSFRPVPAAVIDAVEEHIAISSLVRALIHEAQAGFVAPRTARELGELIERHLVMEEAEVRPLTARRPLLTLAP